MNGQPTAQNTRECGANGDLPAFRNWANDEHVAELRRRLAEAYGVDRDHPDAARLESVLWRLGR